MLVQYIRKQSLVIFLLEKLLKIKDKKNEITAGTLKLIYRETERSAVTIGNYIENN